jgi:hypothetical protein
MATRTVVLYDEQASITSTSDDFIINPTKDVTVVAKLTAGTPVTGCRFMVTIDDVERIAAGTATWVNSPIGNHLATSSERLMRPLTGVRLSSTDGTWTFQVRQV